MSDELFVVGDVHGDAARLEQMLRVLSASERRTIFVGDYVNRGRDSRGVLELLTAARSEAPERFVFLMGNHELSLLEYLDGGDFVRFAALGGIATIRSYVADARGDVGAAFATSFPTHQRAFLRSLLPCWESADVLVSHTGYDPAAPQERSLDALVAKGHPEIFHHAAPPRPLVVCGHYVQRGGAPYVSEHLVCLDTGCGVGGPLTAVTLPEREFITV